MKKIYALLSVLVLAACSYAQTDVVDDILNSDKPKHDYVAYTFKATHVICGQSVEMTKKKCT